MSTPNPPRPKPPIATDRRLWHLGLRQMIITLVFIVVINIVARRIGLSGPGMIVLCAAVALGWPFASAWWQRRKRS